MGVVLQYYSRVLGVLQDDLLAAVVVVRCFTALARLNTTLMSNKLIAQQRTSLTDDITTNRELFQKIIEAAAIALIDNPCSRQVTLVPNARAPTTRALTLGSSINLDILDAAAAAAAKRVTVKSKQFRSNQKRPNVHISLHYPATIKELSTASNANVLIGEDKHRQLKDLIYNTNYNNPKRDLLQALSLEMLVRFLLQNRFLELLVLTAQVKRLYAENPRLFDKILPRSKQDNDHTNETNRDQPTADAHYSNVRVGERIKGYYCKEFLGLPTSSTDMIAGFQLDLTRAFSVDFNKIVSLFSKLVKQQKLLSFDNKCVYIHALVHEVYTQKC